MAFITGKFSARKILTAALGLSAALLLASCGGGGGSAGTNESGGGSSTTATLKLVAPATSTITLPAYGSTTITAQLTATSGNTLSSSDTITFSSPCITSGKATTTALSDTTAGQASVTYTDNGCGTSDIVTIAATGATATSITLAINDTQPTAASISFVSATPTTESIVIAGAGGTGRVESASLLFKVLDTHGNALPNENVAFTLVPTGVVTLQTASGTTDSNGQVTAIVNSGSQATTFRVVATLPSGASTMSDTITVTTGQVSPISMSVSVTTFHIEGWNFDNIPSAVNVLLADSNGNPVADGTPVVSQTDSGAIGTSAIGGCDTVNGACSLAFRSQNPRYGAGNLAVPSGKRAGLATITVSTTTADQSSPIYGYAGIFLSGSYINTTIPFIDTSGGNSILPPSSSVPGYTIKLASCYQGVVTLQLNDVNNNPLPYQAALTVTGSGNGSNASGVPNSGVTTSGISPATVPNQGVDTLVVADQATYQGSFHSVTFTMANNTLAGGSNCSPTGTYPTTPNGIIQVKSTTPEGVVSYGTVYVLYPQSP